MAKTLSPKRFTFTFSNSSGLDEVIKSLENRLKGLNRAEIVKFSLIQLNHKLQKEDEMMEKVIQLTEEEEESLAKAMESDTVYIDTSKPGAIDEYFDQLNDKNIPPKNNEVL